MFGTPALGQTLVSDKGSQAFPLHFAYCLVTQVGSGCKTSLGTRLAWEQGWYNAMIQIRRTAWESTEHHPLSSQVGSLGKRLAWELGYKMYCTTWVNK